jgi:hypothetical protein
VTDDKLYVEGELFLSLEVVAALYQVKTIWLRRVYDVGLLGSGVDTGPVVCIAAVQLDRVATIVRMHDVFGLDLDEVELALDEG